MLEGFMKGLAQDAAVDKLNDFAEDHFNNTNPYEDKNGNKRVLDRNLATKEEQKIWKKIQKQAWVHDKCFLGSCGVGLDCGIGLVPLAAFFLPIFGPLAIYAVHARLVRIAEEELRVPAKLEAKLHANIVFDLLISLPPVIGAFLTWLHGCSTRNAGMLYVYMKKTAEQRAVPVGIDGRREPGLVSDPVYQEQGFHEKKGKKSQKGPKNVVVGQQTSGVR